MTREQAAKILKQLAQRAYCGETITPTLEEVEALFEGAKRLEKPKPTLEEIEALFERAKAPEKPKAQPIYMTDNGKIIPLPEPQALPLPEDWKAGAELFRMINANIDARIKHFLELERERREGTQNE